MYYFKSKNPYDSSFIVAKNYYEEFIKEYDESDLNDRFEIKEVDLYYGYAEV